MVELKLDANTVFEWQKHSQEDTGLPPYEQLLSFIDMRAQALEISSSSHKGSSLIRKPPTRLRLTLEMLTLRTSVLHARLRSTLCIFVSNSKLCHMTIRPKSARLIGCITIALAVDISMQVCAQMQNLSKISSFSPPP